MSSPMRFHTRSHACAAIAVAALAFLFAWASPQAASARVPKNFWGVVPQVLPSDGHFARIRRGGVDSVRITIAWQNVEPAKGTFNWSAVDTAVARAARHRIELLPAVWGSPSWVAKSTLALPVGSAKQRRAWSGFLKSLVHRYGPRGSFWAANPGIPRRPIRIWQIWNEENFFYFTKRPSPTKYAKLVKISHRAIHSADRRARSSSEACSRCRPSDRRRPTRRGRSSTSCTGALRDQAELRWHRAAPLLALLHLPEGDDQPGAKRVEAPSRRSHRPLDHRGRLGIRA